MVTQKVERSTYVAQDKQEHVIKFSHYYYGHHTIPIYI